MASLINDIIEAVVPNPFDKSGNKEFNPVVAWVDGVIFNPWVDVSIQRNLDSLAASCTLSFVDRWRNTPASFPLDPGKKVNVKIDNDSLITGYIDSLDVTISNNSREVTINCRDKTADLIDCSHVGKNKISKTTFLGLAKQLLAPFEINVKFDAAPVDEPFNFESEQSESIFEALARYATPRGYLMQTNGLGELVIFNRDSSSRIERSKTDLIQGENILSATANYDFSDRFSQYIVKGQSPGDDLVARVAAANGGNTVANSSKGEATDAAVDRYRPKIVLSDDKLKAKSATKQAQWECDIRARQSTSVGITVQGWRKADGTLWAPNQLVRVNAGFLGINQDLLISGVNYNKSLGSGTTCDLELTTADAFKAQAEKSADENPIKNKTCTRSANAGACPAGYKDLSKRLTAF